MFPGKVMLQQQAVKLQLLVALAALGICPSLRASLTASRATFFWVYVIRNAIEAWVLLLAFGAIPYMNITFLSRCTRIRTGYPNHDPKSPRDAALDPSEVEIDLALIKKTWWMMLGPLVARPILQLLRWILVSSGLLGEIPLLWKICFCFLILLLLMIAIGIAVRSLVGVPAKLAHASTVDLPLPRLQLTVSLLLIAAGVQDLIFLYYFDGERTANIVSTACFMFEICAATMVTAHYLALDPLVAIAEHHDEVRGVKVPIGESVGRKLHDIFTPFAFRLTPCVDRPVVLPNQHVDEHEVSCESVYKLSAEEQELLKQGQLEQRSVWRLVLFDIFSFKVRSRYLPVIVATIVAVDLLWMFSTMHEWVDQLFPLPKVAHALVLAVVQLLIVAFCWLICGILLIGNNVYFSSSFKTC
jgi:hypothetical protein